MLGADRLAPGLRQCHGGGLRLHVHVAESPVRGIVGHGGRGSGIVGSGAGDGGGAEGSPLAGVERGCGRPVTFGDADEEVHRPAALVKLVGKVKAAPYRLQIRPAHLVVRHVTSMPPNRPVAGAQ